MLSTLAEYGGCCNASGGEGHHEQTYVQVGKIFPVISSPVFLLAVGDDSLFVFSQ